MKTTIKAHQVIISTLKNVENMLETRFEETKNVDYLQAKNRIEDALEIIYDIKLTNQRRQK